MKNYFAFIDESGNPTQEKFFGLGLLLVDDEIGDFYDGIKPFYEKARDIARTNKLARITELSTQTDWRQMADIAKSNRSFELKFKYVNATNNSVYSGLIKKYFSFQSTRFCALVIDKQKMTDDAKSQPVLDPWTAYIHEAAMLIANNIKNVSPCELCVLADDLTRPCYIRKSFEKSLCDAITSRLQKANLPDKVFGVTRLESHSSLMLQVVDILLGSVLYDYKKQTGLISPKLAIKQDPVVEELHSKLGTVSLVGSKTFHQPNYFSVWEYKK